jgi:hypothetical protein
MSLRETQVESSSRFQISLGSTAGRCDGFTVDHVVGEQLAKFVARIEAGRDLMLARAEPSHAVRVAHLDAPRALLRREEVLHGER